MNSLSLCAAAAAVNSGTPVCEFQVQQWTTLLPSPLLQFLLHRERQSSTLSIRAAADLVIEERGVCECSPLQLPRHWNVCKQASSMARGEDGVSSSSRSSRRYLLLSELLEVERKAAVVLGLSWRHSLFFPSQCGCRCGGGESV